MSADCGCGGTCPLCRFMLERVSGEHVETIMGAARAVDDLQQCAEKIKQKGIKGKIKKK